MSGKKSALEVDVDQYFSKLRENVVLAELALMQLVEVTKHLEKRETLPVELRANLEVQERALSDMLVLGIARLFDRKGTKQDQLSIPNILEHNQITLCQNQKTEIKRLGALPTVIAIRTVRDGMVAHSLSHASDIVLKAADLMPIIDDCYKVLADIYKSNKPTRALERKDVSMFSTKWRQMTQSWC